MNQSQNQVLDTPCSGYAWICLVDVEAAKGYDLSEDDQELGPKHVGKIINIVLNIMYVI